MFTQKKDQEKRKGSERNPEEIPKKKKKYEKTQEKEKTEAQKKKETKECPACHKSVNSLFEIKMIDDGKFSCKCGEEWTFPDDMIYCSKKCYGTNCYWMLEGNTLIVEDECHGCGNPIVFDVQIKKENI